MVDGPLLAVLEGKVSGSLQQHIVESCIVAWQWRTANGLAIVCGAAGGGGGAGGAVCIEGLNIYGGSGGDGGDGGNATTLTVRGESYLAAGGNGGYGGDSGRIVDGEPQVVAAGPGCHFGPGGDGGRGTALAAKDGMIVSNGGGGGKGYPGETRVVELADLSYGEELAVRIGAGGNGGRGGQGYEDGPHGEAGEGGFVLLVPLFEPGGGVRC